MQGELRIKINIVLPDEVHLIRPFQKLSVLRVSV